MPLYQCMPSISPMPNELPLPPLNWLKPVTQQAVLDNCDEEVEYTAAIIKLLDGQAKEDAREEWRKAMIKRHFCRLDLIFN